MEDPSKDWEGFDINLLGKFNETNAPERLIKRAKGYAISEYIKNQHPDDYDAESQMRRDWARGKIDLSHIQAEERHWDIINGKSSWAKLMTGKEFRDTEGPGPW